MSITKSQTEKIGSIFNGNRFQIPTYQRKYSWTDIETKALWQDIQDSISNNMNHFLGTLSFREIESIGLTTETYYEIIDGQQRITTLFILLSVLIEKIDDSDTKSSMISAFTGPVEKLKLIPMGKDETFLKTLIYDFGKIEIPTISRRSQLFLYNAKKMFLSLTHSFNQDEVAEFIIFIRDRIDVLVFNISDQSQAVKMFSIINDRGLPLSILDKTKSILMLYSTLYLDSILNDTINNCFEKIFDSYDNILLLRDRLGILGRLEENTIFTHHYYSSAKFFPKTWNNRDGADTIFKNLKLRCELLKGEKEELKNFISAYVLDFEQFAISYDKLVQSVESISLFKKPFQFLEFSATLYPLLVRLFSDNKLIPLIQILEAIEVRVYKLKNTNPIADIYSLSSEINDQKFTLDEIKAKLLNFNEKFMSNHNFKNYLDTDIYLNGATKFILSEYSSMNIPIDEYRNLQVDHIFSKEPNFEISTYGFSDDYDYEKNRIGNLTLLETELNAGASNSPPINKVDRYLKSIVKSTNEIAGEIQKEEINKSYVDKRRLNIINFCLSRFEIK